MTQSSNTLTLATLTPKGATKRVRVTADSNARLTEVEREDLRFVLENKYEAVESALFGKAEAQRLIFDEAPAIPVPDPSWYHPVVDAASMAGRLGKTTGSVLLNAQQERALFLQFNYCRHRVAQYKAQIQKRVDPRVPLKLARPMLHWYRRAEAYKDQIAATNLALVLAMAKRTRLTDVEFGDMVSEGNMALLRAIDKFDAGRGFKFSTYACRAILKAFSRIGMKQTRYRAMFPADYDPKLERGDHVETRRADAQQDTAAEVGRLVRDKHADLTDIEQEVIVHRFGLSAHADNKPLTLEQVGKIIGVTKERVRQIQNRALEKLRETLEEQYL